MIFNIFYALTLMLSLSCSFSLYALDDKLPQLFEDQCDVLNLPTTIIALSKKEAQLLKKQEKRKKNKKSSRLSCIRKNVLIDLGMLYMQTEKNKILKQMPSSSKDATSDKDEQIEPTNRKSKNPYFCRESRKRRNFLFEHVKGHLETLPEDEQTYFNDVVNEIAHDDFQSYLTWEQLKAKQA